jgi:hypothetical protein
MKRLTLLACAMVATGLAAAADMYDQPYSRAETGDRSEVRKEFPLAITQIDGVSTRNPRRTDPIAPGKHRVTVRFETARVAQSAAETTRDLEINFEACTLYRIVAERKGATNWDPKVYSEAIGECVKKFGKKG